MAEPAPNSELLRSLGRLVRGLSALFWGLPVALISCVWTAFPQLARSFGFLPPLVSTGLLVFGLWQISVFQKQERVWRNALDRALVLATVEFGLSPFLFWWSRMPDNRFFLAMMVLMIVCGLAFMASLNVVLQRLGAMLPDEALRMEIKQFTAFNLNLLGVTLVVGGVYALLSRPQDLPVWLRPAATAIQQQKVPIWLQIVAERFLQLGPWFLLLLVLLPLAMTMALLWKTKEVILENVFGPQA